MSKRSLKPHKKQELIEKFYRALLKQNSLEMIENFSSFLMTSTEVHAFAKRLEIIKQLREGDTYEEIKDNVKVTNVTITKMRNILFRANEQFLEFLDNLITHDSFEREQKRKARYTKGSKQFYLRRRK